MMKVESEAICKDLCIDHYIKDSLRKEMKEKWNVGSRQL